MLKKIHSKRFKPIFRWGIFLFVCSILGTYLFQVMSTGNSNSGKNTGLLNDIIQIIHYGALAPSTHNAQMWQVKVVSDHEIVVMLDQSHILPQIDPTNRESLISLGAFIENICESAPKFNLKAEVTILAQNPNDHEIARIVFKPELTDSVAKIQIVQNIKNRHTIRTPFLPQELTEPDRNRLINTIQNLSYFPLESATGQYLKDAIIQSTQQQAANDKKQAELADWIRFSKKEAELKKDGLTPEMMGLSGFAEWFVSAFYTHKSVLSKSFRGQTVAAARKQSENCAGFVILTSPDDSAAALVNTGRNLEQFLNTAAGVKIAVQPMSAPLEESPWKEAIGPKTGLTHPVQMLLRVGYVKNYGQPVSRRRDVLIIQN